MAARSDADAPPPAVPPGTRLYAIGDIHGRRDLLDELIDRIEEDDVGRPPADTRIIFLGDLIDRGADSRGVVERVRALCGEGRARMLKGNHEEVFVRAAAGDGKAARTLIELGGKATLLSYGLTEAEIEAGSFQDLADLLRERVPRDHVAFLRTGESMIALGDYLFVHAGIRPGRALEDQSGADLRWIRGSFLDSEEDHGVIVVHGHTPSEEVELRPNRIGIDTGAYASGTLSALGLEGSDRWLLQTRRERGACMKLPPAAAARIEAAGEARKPRFFGLF